MIGAWHLTRKNNNNPPYPFTYITQSFPFLMLEIYGSPVNLRVITALDKPAPLTPPIPPTHSTPLVLTRANRFGCS